MEVIETLRPALQADGGDIRVVSLDEENGILNVELLGACVGCSLSTMTLKAGVERILCDRVEGLKTVNAINVPDEGSEADEFGELT
jgi:Fe-S cluster biogenesis protein NfuA